MGHVGVHLHDHVVTFVESKTKPLDIGGSQAELSASV